MKKLHILSLMTLCMSQAFLSADAMLGRDPRTQTPVYIQSMVGTKSTSNSPDKFTVATEFASPGLAGNYFASTQLATIHDPSGKNPVSYTFENVRAYSEQKRFSEESGMSYIGKIENQNDENMYLYGTLVENN